MKDLINTLKCQVGSEVGIGIRLKYDKGKLSYVKEHQKPLIKNRISEGQASREAETQSTMDAIWCQH